MSDLISQITADLKSQIESFKPALELRDVGSVLEAGDGIARVGGLAEVVSDGGTGLLVPPGDPAALALAVTRYFREGCRERMAQAIEQARPRFDWQNLVMLIEEMVK